MFSYRHAFHAGNHADVLKHTVLLAILRHMVQKDTPFTVFDTHAGAGLYRLDGDFAKTSEEAAEGFLKLMAAPAKEPFAPVLQDYVDMVASFNQQGSHRVYPGSPFVIQRLLRDRDKLKLFEIHPTDTKTLTANVAQLEAGRQVAILREDGFEGIKKFLPPPSRRALVFCDPSYEMKTDYGRAADFGYHADEGVDHEALSRLPHVDFATFHLYPDHWGQNVAWGSQWIDDHLAVAADIGKPTVLEEYGLWGSTHADRDAVYATWNDAFIAGDGGGSLFWMLGGYDPIGPNSLYEDYDDFTIYYPSSTATALSARATQMNAKRIPRFSASN